MKKVFLFCCIFVTLFSGCFTDRRIYKIAIDPAFVPENMAGQADQVYGFTIDLLGEIAQSENIRIQYFQAGSESLLNGLERKSYDAVLTTKVNTLIERNIYQVSSTYFLMGPVLVVPVDSKVDKLENLDGKLAGVVDQSSGYFVIQKYPKIFIFSYQNPATLLEALKYEQIDAACVDYLAAIAYVKNLYANVFKIATEPLNDDGLCLVMMQQNNTSLVDSFNQGLRRAKKRGVYQKLLEKWQLSV